MKEVHHIRQQEVHYHILHLSECGTDIVADQVLVYCSIFGCG